MWLQPSLKVSISHESRLAWPLLSFPLTFLALRAHCCLLLNLLSSRTPRAFSAKLLFSCEALGHELVTRIALSQGQRFALPLVEIPDVPVSPFLQPAEAPLGGSTTFWFLSHSSEMCVIRKVAESTLCPIIQIFMMMLNRIETHIDPQFGFWYLFSSLGKVTFHH